MSLRTSHLRARRARPCANGLGFVYLVNDGYYTKVGIIATPTPDLDLLGRRLAMLQCGNAYQLAYSAWAFVASARRLELALHERLRHQNIRGEWFHLSPAAQKWTFTQLSAHAIAPAAHLDVRNLLPLINALRAGTLPRMAVESDSRVRRVDPKRAARIAVQAAIEADPAALALVLRPPRVVCRHLSGLMRRPCTITTPHEH